MGPDEQIKSSELQVHTSETLKTLNGHTLDPNRDAMMATMNGRQV